MEQQEQQQQFNMVKALTVILEGEKMRRREDRERFISILKKWKMRSRRLVGRTSNGEMKRMLAEKDNEINALKKALEEKEVQIKRKDRMCDNLESQRRSMMMEARAMQDFVKRIHRKGTNFIATEEEIMALQLDISKMKIVLEVPPGDSYRIILREGVTSLNPVVPGVSRIPVLISPNGIQEDYTLFSLLRVIEEGEVITPADTSKPLKLYSIVL